MHGILNIKVTEQSGSASSHPTLGGSTTFLNTSLDMGLNVEWRQQTNRWTQRRKWSANICACWRVSRFVCTFTGRFWTEGVWRGQYSCFCNCQSSSAHGRYLIGCYWTVGGAYRLCLWGRKIMMSMIIASNCSEYVYGLPGREALWYRTLHYITHWFTIPITKPFPRRRVRLWSFRRSVNMHSFNRR
jgi:hypothetical protein